MFSNRLENVFDDDDCLRATEATERRVGGQIGEANLAG